MVQQEKSIPFCMDFCIPFCKAHQIYQLQLWFVLNITLDHPSFPPILLLYQFHSLHLNGKLETKLSGQQIPIQLRYATTIHKSQRQTFLKVVIGISKSALAAGCAFVAISQLPSLECDLIIPMTF